MDYVEYDVCVGREGGARLGSALRAVFRPKSRGGQRPHPLSPLSTRTKNTHQKKTHISVLLIRQGGGARLLQLGLVLLHQRRVDLHLGRGEGGGSDKLERRVADELAREPEEGLLKVVLFFSRSHRGGGERGVSARFCAPPGREGQRERERREEKRRERERRRTKRGAQLTFDFAEISKYCKFFFLWNVTAPVLTLRSLTSTLLPQRTMGIDSQTRSTVREQSESEARRGERWEN